MTITKVLGSLIGVAVASIALARLHPSGDPQRSIRQSRVALLQGADLPDAARRTLIAKCADCHSDATHWPIYAWAAPVSWLVEHDVMEGRAHMNLSRWKDLSADQREAQEQEITQQIKRGAMPPLSYRLVHWKANLNQSDRDALTALVSAGSVEPAPNRSGDAERGRSLFNRRCSGCHALDADREGPRLRDVYGRRAGSVSSFHYSSAIRTSGVTWTEASLDRWLSDSDSMLPGNAMGFSVPKPQERSDIIAFLKSLQ